MSITSRGFGTSAQGSTSVAPGLPASLATGDIVLIFVMTKPDTATINVPTDWTLLADVAGGGGTTGPGVGPTRQAVFFREKDAGWSTMPTVSVTSGNSTVALSIGFAKAAGTTWGTAAATGTFGSAGITADGTTTLGSNPGITAGDMCVVGYSSDDDTAVAISGHGVTATGTSGWSSTIGTAQTRVTATGNDVAGVQFRTSPSTGTATAAPVTSVSFDEGTCGTAALVRLREVAGATPGQGSGTGTWAFAGAGSGTRAPVATGSGTFAFTGAGTGARASLGSGSGTLAFAGAGAGTTTRTGTGTGTWAFTGAGVGETPTGPPVSEGSGTGTWAFVGAGVGHQEPQGTGTGTWDFTGAGAGVAPVPTPPGEGTGSGTWVFVGTSGGGIGGQWQPTDTTNRVGGRRRGGYAVAVWEPPVAEPPPTLVFGHAVDAAAAYSAVTVNGTQPEYTVTRAERVRHRDRIVVGGKDVTYLRDKPTPLPSYQLVSPLLYGPATLRLPQIAVPFEHLGVGALSWLKPGKTVKVQRVDAETGEVVATDYKGVVIALNTAGRDLTVEVGGEASGRAALMEKQLPIFRGVLDIGDLAYRAIRALGLPFQPRLGPSTGIKLARFGGTGHLDYIAQLCARAWTRSGNQWTIMPVNGVYRMARKDTTTIDATAYLDDARTVGELSRDIAEEHNRIYVTGITPEGQRVRFGVYPGLKQGKAAPYPYNNNRTFGAGTANADTDTGDGVSVMIYKLRVHKYLSSEESAGGYYDSDVVAGVKELQDDVGLPVTGTMTPATWRALYDLDAVDFSLRGSHIEPAAQRRYTREFIRSGSGAIMRRNPDYDEHRLKSDRTIDMGSGFTISQMREYARTLIADAVEDNVVGTITFHTGALVGGDHTPGDPVTPGMVFRARRLVPGMNLKLPHSAFGPLTVHVSAVSVDEDGKVSATVDTRARDSMEVWEVLARNRESRANPARQWVRQHRASGTIKDAVDGWDEVGGLLGDKVTVPGRTWTAFPVVAGQEGTIARLALETSPNAQFVVAVLGRGNEDTIAKALTRHIGNPLTKKGAKRWADESVRNRLETRFLLLYAAGDSEQPCGYFPKNKRPETVITDEANPDYDPTADPDHVGTDDEPTIEVETETGSITPLTGRWKDDAGFGYRTFAQPVIYVAVYADRDTAIPAGRIMWPQLEAGA